MINDIIEKMDAAYQVARHIIRPMTSKSVNDRYPQLFYNLFNYIRQMMASIAPMMEIQKRSDLKKDAVLQEGTADNKMITLFGDRETLYFADESVVKENVKNTLQDQKERLFDLAPFNNRTCQSDEYIANITVPVKYIPASLRLKIQGPLRPKGKSSLYKAVDQEENDWQLDIRIISGFRAKDFDNTTWQIIKAIRARDTKIFYNDDLPYYNDYLKDTALQFRDKGIFNISDNISEDVLYAYDAVSKIKKSNLIQ